MQPTGKTTARNGVIIMGVVLLLFAAYSSWESEAEDSLNEMDSPLSNSDSPDGTPRRSPTITMPPRQAAVSSVSDPEDLVIESADQEKPGHKDVTLIRGVVLGNLGKPIANERIFLRSLKFTANGNGRSAFESNCLTDTGGRFEFRTKKLGQKSVDFQFIVNRKTVQHQVSFEVEEIGNVMDLGEITVPERNCLSLSIRVLDPDGKVIPGCSVSIVPYSPAYSSIEVLADENGLCEVEAWDQDVELMITTLVGSPRHAVSCKLLSRRHSGHAEKELLDAGFVNGAQRVFYYDGSSASVELRDFEPDTSGLRTFTILAPVDHVEGNRHTYAIYAYQKDGSLRLTAGLAGCLLPLDIDLKAGKYFVQVGLLTRDRFPGGTVVRETCFSLHDNIDLEQAAEIKPSFVRGIRVQGVVLKSGLPSVGRLVAPRFHAKVKIGGYLTKRTNVKGEFVAFLPQTGPAELLFTQAIGVVRVIPVDRSKAMADAFGDQFIDLGIIIEDL